MLILQLSQLILISFLIFGLSFGRNVIIIPTILAIEPKSSILSLTVRHFVLSIVFNMPKCTQEIRPYLFGHPYTKKTRLWLKGLPLLQPTKIMYERTPAMKSKWFAYCTGDKSKKRSKLFLGIAEAMALQWGGCVDN